MAGRTGSRTGRNLSCPTARADSTSMVTPKEQWQRSPSSTTRTSTRRCIISTAGAMRHWYNQWNLKPLAPRFTHVLETSRPIEGTVTDKATGEPVGGVVIEMSVSRPMDWLFHFKTSTDAKGRYRVQGVGWSRPNLYANVGPPRQSGYLPFQAQHDEPWTVGAEKLVWNFTVRRGQVVRGTVIDQETRKPIPGAQVAGAGEMLTDQTGNFAMAMLPGQQFLFVEGPTPDYERVTVPRGQSDSSATLFPHGYARIDVPRDRGAEPVEIALKRGATISAQAVDSQDKPVSDVVVSGLSLFARLDRSGQTARHYASGLFRMASFVPGKPYRIFFIQNERHLAGFADITPRGEAGQPVPVALRPMASVQGKLLKPYGAPIVGKRVMAHLQTTPRDVELDPMGFLEGGEVLSYGLAAQGMGPMPSTNDRGEFTVDDLVPGVRNYLSFELSSNRVEYVPIDPLEPGEVRTLGVVKPIVLTEKN